LDYPRNNRYNAANFYEDNVMQEQTMQDKDFSTSQTFKRLWPMISPFKSGLFVAAVALFPAIAWLGCQAKW